MANTEEKFYPGQIREIVGVREYYFDRSRIIADALIADLKREETSESRCQILRALKCLSAFEVEIAEWEIIKVRLANG